MLADRASGALCRRYEPDASISGALHIERIRLSLIVGTTLAAFAMAHARYGLGREYLVSVVFASIMMVVAAVDIQTYFIPNCLVIAGTIALAALIAVGLVELRPAAAGALTGGLIMLLAAVACRGGLGAGDVKLSFVIGGFVGWPGIALALFAGFGVAAIAGLGLMAAGRKRGKDPIPFGPCLAAGGILARLYGPPVMAWYWSRMMSA